MAWKDSVFEKVITKGVKGGRRCHTSGGAEHASATVQDLYRIADEALYRAKRKGRNRTVVADAAA